MMHVDHVEGLEAALVIMAERSDLMAGRSKAVLEDRLRGDLDILLSASALLVDAANEANLHDNPPAGPCDKEDRTLNTAGLLY
jgi:hypothetical protein